ncbi:hypothetical protein D3C72_2528050 [compost metagenome]
MHATYALPDVVACRRINNIVSNRLVDVGRQAIDHRRAGQAAFSDMLSALQAIARDHLAPAQRLMRIQ